MRPRTRSTYGSRCDKSVQDEKSRIVKKKNPRSNNTKQQNNIQIAEKTVQSVAPIDRLPDELLLHILSCLDVRTLYRCRRVSKRWYKWANQVKFSKLVLANHLYIFFNHKLFPSDDHWFNTDIQIDYELDSINQYTFHRLPFKRLQNLKRLKVSTREPLFNVYEPGLRCRKAQTITLPSLKCLHFECGCSPRSEKRNITFDTPNLKSLKSDLIGVQFVNPLTVQVLELIGNRQDSSAGDFKNVKILTADVNLFPANQWCLTKFPRMVELHLQINHSTRSFAQWCVDRFIVRKIELAKNDLKLYFLDTLLDDDSKRYKDYRFDEKYQHLIYPEYFSDLDFSDSDFSGLFNGDSDSDSDF